MKQILGVRCANGLRKEVGDVWDARSSGKLSSDSAVVKLGIDPAGGVGGKLMAKPGKFVPAPKTEGIGGKCGTKLLCAKVSLGWSVSAMSTRD